MAKTYQIFVLICVLTLFSEFEAVSAPFFIQAIASALSAVPFTGGPITTGLAGAKLAIGAKLLYFLGYFGRRSKRAAVPVPAVPLNTGFKVPGMGSPGMGVPGMGGSMYGFQPVPLPYALFGNGGFGAGNFQPAGGFDPNVYRGPYGNFDPAQLFQMLADQGRDFGANIGRPPTNFGGGNTRSQAGILGSNGPVPMHATTGVTGLSSGSGVTLNDASLNTGDTPEKPVATQNQADVDDMEDFFEFLRGMDDNTCISRLLCDIGADPSILGEFSENVNSVVGTLDVKPTSGAFTYVQIMQRGKTEGRCSEVFPACSDTAYDVVKNIAPTVGVPSNLESQS